MEERGSISAIMFFLFSLELTVKLKARIIMAQFFRIGHSYTALPRHYHIGVTIKNAGLKNIQKYNILNKTSQDSSAGRAAHS